MKHKATTAGTTRIVFLDYLRVLACLMVIATHSCDSFYIGPGGVWQCASESDRLWISIIDSIMRAAVPLFVMTSSYLLLPLKDDNTTFFKRRFIRVLVPFCRMVVHLRLLACPDGGPARIGASHASAPSHLEL